MKRSLRITPDMVSDTVPDMDMKKSAHIVCHFGGMSVKCTVSVYSL